MVWRTSSKQRHQFSFHLSNLQQILLISNICPIFFVVDESGNPFEAKLTWSSNLIKHKEP
jgi:hypothetical protein